MTSPTVPVRWRELVWPKEHGSWSLAFEPLALGLIAAPSLAGLAFGGSVAAAFFARRPLRTALTDVRPERRTAASRAVATCAAVAIAAAVLAFVLAGTAWIPWLLPSVVAGAIFLAFDLRQEGREQYAEIAGSAAFGWLPAVIAVLGGCSTAVAASLAFAMLARTLPTVLTVRATIRQRKSGVAAPGLPLAASAIATVAAVALARFGSLPWLTVALIALLAGRSFGLLVCPVPALRASTIGKIEAIAGAVYVIGTAIAWRL